MEQNLIKKYATLLVKTGVNLQKGQAVVITAEVNDAYFVRELTKVAYEEGASDVTISWKDEYLSKARYLYAEEEKFETVPTWMAEFFKNNDDIGGCYINVISSDPDLFKDVSSERMRKWSFATGKAFKEHRVATMENHVRWTIGAIPSVNWSKKVFPNLPEEEAVKKLWEYIAKAVRIDTEDPVKAWCTHVNNFKEKLKFLNNSKLKYLKYKNSLGTDATIELPKGHIWEGGSGTCQNGMVFCPNMPTEEIYTLPYKFGVNGKIVSSMPLSYNGVLIENFSFDFADGKVVACKAEKNQQTLENILSLDEGAKYLGEVALIPQSSPIAEMNVLFYNTLFDENASCHFAIGKAYPLIEGYEKMNEEEKKNLGINDSVTHVDFMVGTKDLSILGIDESGKEIAIFENGNWACF